MGKLFTVLSGVYGVFVRYPAITAGVVNIAVAVGSKFGLHLTADQIVTVVSFTAAITAVLVHAGVIPVNKVANVKAGLKPTVPSEAVVIPPVTPKV